METNKGADERRFRLVSVDELLALAQRHRTIGVHEPRWSFAQSPDDGLALIRTTGPRYLYRGQTKRYNPCFPSLYRHLKAPARFLADVSLAGAVKIAADIARTFWYYAEIERHPIFRWAKAEHLHLPLLELAQHYGMPTPLLDLTESIEVALFFATHRFRDGAFEPCTSGTGIVYRIDRTTMPPAFAQRFTSVAIQPFPRPTQQWAWTCELMMGECFEAYPWLGVLEFEQSESLANAIRSMAEAAGSLFPPDVLADVVEEIRTSNALPMAWVEEAAKHLDGAFPVKRFGTLAGALEAGGYSLLTNVPAVLTEERAEELEPTCQAAIETWEKASASRLEQLWVRGGLSGM